MSCVPYSSFTWNGITLIPLNAPLLTIVDWQPEPKQEERHIAGTARVQIVTFGVVWRWSGEVQATSLSDYGALQTAWLAQPRTTATWSDGTNSYPGVTLTQFRLFPSRDSDLGYIGTVEFVRTQ